MKRLRAWWHSRNDRERLMLAVMAAALAAFFYWFGLWRPLERWRDAGQSRYLRAAAAHIETEALLAGNGAGTVAGRLGAAYLQTIRDSAARAGIEIARHGHDPATGPSVAAVNVTPATLWAWLDSLRGEHGLVPRTLHLERRDGGIEVQLQFPPAHAGERP